MHRLKQYWQQLFAHAGKKKEPPHDRPPAVQEELKRSIADVSMANRALAADLEKLRREIEESRSRDRHRLAETSSQLDNTRAQVRTLKDGIAELARTFDTSLSRATHRFENTAHQVGQLEAGQRRLEQTSLQMQAQLRIQGRRAGWTMGGMAFVLLVVILAGAILNQDRQTNAAVLADISRDIRHLVVSMGKHLDTPHAALAEVPVIPPGAGGHTSASENEHVTKRHAEQTDLAISPARADSMPENSRAVSGLSGDSAGYPAMPALPGIRKSTIQETMSFFGKDAGNQGTIGLPGGLHYRVVKAGRGRSPDVNDTVLVNFIGVHDGRVLDDTYSTGQPVTLYLSELDPGWQETLSSMQEGAEWEVFLPPEIIRDGTGGNASVPGSGPAMYLIELLEISEGSAVN
jgi:hypothetical protein